MPPGTKDLTGQKFGKLTALEYTNIESQRGAAWICQCDCGTITTVRAYSLKSGITRSCGCLRQESIKDLTGKRFGRLIVKEQGENIRGRLAWNCLCDCGKTTNVLSASLKNGFTKSCGCLKKDASRAIGERSRTHGGKKTRLYYIWQSMKQRCFNPNRKDYRNYGGRGVTVCEEWKNDFASFRDWALANGYDDSLTIDRIENDGDYSPENCQWLTNTRNAAKQWIDKAA